MIGGMARLLNIFALILLLCRHESCRVVLGYSEGSMLAGRKADELLPYTDPAAAPQPLLPLLAPSPLMPFTNSTIPRLSGRCPLNFTALSGTMMITSTNCMGEFAPFLANVVCCPQVEATLAILVGQSSKHTGLLALNQSTAAHCLSDFEQVLAGQGANANLSNICSVRGSNLTEGSCPVTGVSEFESAVDVSGLLAACSKIDSVNECCEQVCQNEIVDASTKLSEEYALSNAGSGSDDPDNNSTRISDCKSIVLRWLGSKLEVNAAKEVLRGLSNCRVNKVCPLNFPSISRVVEGCGSGESNQTACCGSVDSYVSDLQQQSFVTNLQALNCAALLGAKLQRANVTENVYSLCRINLKDFSLQVGMQKSGCLLSSLPSDVVFDKSAGVSFLCDLNDDILAPWPSTTQSPPSSCNKTLKVPAFPVAASGQNRFHAIDGVRYLVGLVMVMGAALFVGI